MTPGAAVQLIESAISPWFVVEHPYPNYLVMQLRRDGWKYRLSFEIEERPDAAATPET